jgi:hypothetical protein
LKAASARVGKEGAILNKTLFSLLPFVFDDTICICLRTEKYINFIRDKRMKKGFISKLKGGRNSQMKQAQN